MLLGTRYNVILTNLLDPSMQGVWRAYGLYEIHFYRKRVSSVLSVFVVLDAPFRCSS